MIKKILAIAFVFMMVSCSSGEKTVENNSEKEMYPPIMGTDILTSKTYSTTSLRGKWLLIEYWRMSCPFCRKMLPILHQVNEERDLNIVSIMTDKAPIAKRKGFLLQNDVKYIVFEWQDAYESLFTNVPGVPFFYIVSPDGEIKETIVGFKSKEDMDLLLDKYEIPLAD